VADVDQFLIATGVPTGSMNEVHVSARRIQTTAEATRL